MPVTAYYAWKADRRAPDDAVAKKGYGYA